MLTSLPPPTARLISPLGYEPFHLKVLLKAPYKDEHV